MTKPLADSNLFKAINVGHVTLSNRLVHAPTTRYRNSIDFVPTDSMLEYYKQHAVNNEGGLIIAEATFPNPKFGIKDHAPMIHTIEQVKAWQEIVSAVHEAGSFIGLQFCNLGLKADPKELKKHGIKFLGPSKIYSNTQQEKVAIECENELQEMSKDEIKQMVIEYAEASERAVHEAGFDFVEIQAAHSFMLDAFMQESSNERTDEYGGSIENRARFLLEVVDAVVKAVGADHVAIRISPYGNLRGPNAINPIISWGYVLDQLEKKTIDGKRLAYLSVIEPRMYQNMMTLPLPNLSWVPLLWKGIILTSGFHLDPSDLDKLASVVGRDDKTLIGVARYFTSNPDLAERLKKGQELTPYDRSTFYVPLTNVGYLNYGKYGYEQDHSKDKIIPQPLF